MNESTPCYSGSCLCGGVRFSVRPPTLFCAHCHCHYCRRAHGAALVTWFGVRATQLTLTDDAGLLRWYRSSQPSRRGFCSRCGTTLFFESTLAPGEVHIARALVPGAIDREPSGHCFSEQSVAWLTVADTLPHYDSDSDALAHYRVIPTLD